jgi:hypothetical protein
MQPHNSLLLGCVISAIILEGGFHTGSLSAQRAQVEQASAANFSQADDLDLLKASASGCNTSDIRQIFNAESDIFHATPRYGLQLDPFRRASLIDGKPNDQFMTHAAVTGIEEGEPAEFRRHLKGSRSI